MTGTPLEPVRICASEDLVDGGDGVRHKAVDKGGEATVFFVRYDGKPFGYLNRCAHVPMEMDWSEGKFFESSGLYLMCATHGAIYEPDTGKCVGGPCRGARLRRVAAEDRDTPEGRARLLASRQRSLSGLTVLAGVLAMRNEPALHFQSVNQATHVRSNSHRFRG